MSRIKGLVCFYEQKPQNNLIAGLNFCEVQCYQLQMEDHFGKPGIRHWAAILYKLPIAVVKNSVAVAISRGSPWLIFDNAGGVGEERRKNRKTVKIRTFLSFTDDSPSLICCSRCCSSFIPNPAKPFPNSRL